MSKVFIKKTVHYKIKSDFKPLRFMKDKVTKTQLKSQKVYVNTTFENLNNLNLDWLTKYRKAEINMQLVQKIRIIVVLYLYNGQNNNFCICRIMFYLEVDLKIGT